MRTRDGVDHIRIHLDANTELGRKLSEFQIRPFTVEPYAEFSHLLGYSLWLKTGKCHSQLRHLTPFECLRIAKSYPGVWNKQFHEEYKNGVRASLLTDPKLLDMFLANGLPLMIYKVTPGDLMGNDRDGLRNIYQELDDELS